jgi:enoyl-CoA hydratase/carnithine racemase
MHDAAILTEREDGIFRISIHRPAKRNALTRALYTALADAIEAAERDPTCRVMLLHGSEGCFTSGNDLKDFAEGPPPGAESPVLRFLTVLSQAEKPLAAAVEGPAVGIGTTLLLHCDLVYAGAGARFQLPFVNLGLGPEAASSLLLPRLAGYQRAAELLLLGEPFTAAQAQAIGLVNAVVPDEEVVEYARERARKLAAQPPASVRLTKRLLKQPLAAHVEATIEAEARHFAERLGSPEAAEAFAAFFARRPPDFSRFS